MKYFLDGEEIQPDENGNFGQDQVEKFLMDFLSQPVCKMAADLNITVEQMERLLLTWSQPTQ